MVVKNNERLGKYTTIGIGGTAKTFYIPQTVDELIELVHKLNDYYIISAGSNLLINDKRIYESVIYMGEVCCDVKNLGNGHYYCGASVRLQRLLSIINHDGYGGIEALVTIPAMIGGMVYMNASIGKDVVAISDYIKCVHVIHNGCYEILDRQLCCFAHRSSVFQIGGYIIVAVEFQFQQQPVDVSKEKIKERLSDAKLKLDHSCKNFGSVFRKCDYKTMARLSRVGVKRGGASLSKKSVNWINNDGTGTFADVMFVIKVCKLFHRILRKDIDTEVVIWE